MYMYMHVSLFYMKFLQCICRIWD